MQMWYLMIFSYTVNLTSNIEKVLSVQKVNIKNELNELIFITVLL